MFKDIKYNSKDDRTHKDQTSFVFVREALPPKGKELGDYANPFEPFGIKVCANKDWKEQLLKVLK